MTMRHAFDPCPDQVAFRFSNGARARSLEELRKEVQASPAEVLQYHRQHIHHWVRDILQDPLLAERVRTEGERARDGEQLRKGLDRILDASLREAKDAMPSPAAGATRGFAAATKR